MTTWPLSVLFVYAVCDDNDNDDDDDGGRCERECVVEGDSETMRTERV